MRAFRAQRLRQKGGIHTQLQGGSSRWAVAALVAAWYGLSVLLSLYNKHLLGRGRGHFPAPLLLTGVQFGFQSVLVRTLLLLRPLRHLAPKPLPQSDWLRRVVPVSLAAAADVSFSNLSLIYITLSFYTMCKSVTPLYLLAFVVAMRIEPLSFGLVASIVLIVAGVACAVAGETQFELKGFALVMLAAALSGLRWALTQRLMSRNGAWGLGTPLGAMCTLMPIMAAACLTASLLFERPWAVLPASPYFASFAAGTDTACLVALAACMAFGMTASEFTLMRATSAVTLSVVGTVKEAFSVLVFTLVDGDSLGVTNGIGLALLCAGVWGYHASRQRHSGGGHKPAQGLARTSKEKQPLLHAVDGADPETGERRRSRGPASPRPRAGGVGDNGHAASTPEEQYRQILLALLPDKGR